MAKAIESLKAAEQCFGEGLYNSSVSDLNVVQDLRHTADYRENDVSKRQAARALEKARGFVGRYGKEQPMAKSISSPERRMLEYDICMTEVHMRTTVILKDDLVKKAKKLSGEKTLSALLNDCLAAWIAQHSTRELKARLLDEYKAARKESRRVGREFAGIDKEGWPSW